MGFSSQAQSNTARLRLIPPMPQGCVCFSEATPPVLNCASPLKLGSAKQKTLQRNLTSKNKEFSHFPGSFKPANSLFHLSTCKQIEEAKQLSLWDQSGPSSFLTQALASVPISCSNSADQGNLYHVMKIMGAKPEGYQLHISEPVKSAWEMASEWACRT